MKEMFLTKEGTLTDSVTRVTVAEDGTICKTHNECSAYEKLGFKPVYTEQITFNGDTWHYPELNGYDLEVVYSRKQSLDDFKVCFGIDKDGLYLKEVFYWNRCRERDDYINIEEFVGRRIDNIKDIKIDLYMRD